MENDTKVTRGSGNVFADLQLPEAQDELFKARLVAVIRDLIERQGISQTVAAERMHIAQPDVSKLVRGRLSGFSLERLLGFVRALGSDVEITVKAANSDREGRMSLMVA